MSSRRQEALASLPIIIPEIDINDEDNKFTRSFTSAAIGGSIQCMIVRYVNYQYLKTGKTIDWWKRVSSSGTDLARGRNIEEYLCPRLDHNPWCPSVPGQHGYMFVGLGRDKDTYTIPKLCNLFVGIPKCGEKSERNFRYLGVYRVSRVESLNVSEWETLGQEVRCTPWFEEVVFGLTGNISNRSSRTMFNLPKTRPETHDRKTISKRLTTLENSLSLVSDLSVWSLTMSCMQGFSHSAPSIVVPSTVELPNETVMMTMKVTPVRSRPNGVLATDCCRTDAIINIPIPFERFVLRLLSWSSFLIDFLSTHLAS